MIRLPLRFATCIAVAGLLLAAASCNGPSVDGSSDAVQIGGPFTLTGTDGAPVSSADFAGRPMVIYFGYAYCPDVCPLALNKLAVALEIVGPRADVFQPILITIDPERDTPEVLGRYVENNGFPEHLIGLTGSVEDITSVADAFLVHAKKIVSSETEDDYVMEHTSVLYLTDANGRFVDAFTHSSTPQEIADRLTQYLDAH